MYHIQGFLETICTYQRGKKNEEKLERWFLRPHTAEDGTILNHIVKYTFLHRDITTWVDSTQANFWKELQPPWILGELTMVKSKALKSFTKGHKSAIARTTTLTSMFWIRLSILKDVRFLLCPRTHKVPSVRSFHIERHGILSHVWYTKVCIAIMPHGSICSI